MHHDDVLEMLQYQRFLLTQTGVRLERFQEAFAVNIRPGDTVLDLGSGSGILAFLALAAGASRVFAIEARPVIEIAKLLARSNGFGARIVFIENPSDVVLLPEPVDVLVTDTFGPGGFQPGGLRFVVDARKRLLKADGRLIPAAMDLFVAPIDQPDAYRDNVDAWDRCQRGIDLAAVRPLAVNNLYPIYAEEHAILAEPGCWTRVDLASVTDVALQGDVCVTARRPGVLHGVCGWFTSKLVEGVELTNRPGASTTNYAQWLFPIATPLDIDEGDQLRIRIASHDGGDWRWRVDVDRPLATGATERVASFDHSTLQGAPLSGPSALRSFFGGAAEEPLGRTQNRAPQIQGRKQKI